MKQSIDIELLPVYLFRQYTLFYSVCNQIYQKALVKLQVALKFY